MLPDLIETARCRLRPLTMADVDPVAQYAASPDWGRYLPVPQPYTREHAEAYIAAQLEADRAAAPTWAIECGGELVGICSLVLRRPWRSAEVGISLAPARWGSGLATEALRGLIAAAFGADDDLRRIEAYADVRNERSRAMLTRAGFLSEGIMRSRRQVRGEQVDDVVFAVLREEWSGEG